MEIQSFIVFNTRRPRTAELSGLLSAKLQLRSSSKRFPPKNKSLERNIKDLGLLFASLKQNQDVLYAAQLGR